MSGKDEYYNKSKQQGYRARSAYKLKQIDEEANLFERGDTVVDLGAAPGGWLQVAAEEVGESGTVVGVDLQRIDDLDDHDVETIRGDMTEERTRHYLREAIGERGADVVISGHGAEHDRRIRPRSRPVGPPRAAGVRRGRGLLAPAAASS